MKRVRVAKGRGDKADKEAGAAGGEGGSGKRSRKDDEGFDPREGDQTGNDSMECPVCLEEMKPTSGRRVSKPARIVSYFPCGHCTCNACFSRVTVCPMCRTSKNGISGQEQREMQQEMQRNIPEFIRRLVGDLQSIPGGITARRLRRHRSPQVVRYEPGDGGNPANFTLTMYSLPFSQIIAEMSRPARVGDTPTGFLANQHQMTGVPHFDPLDERTVTDQ